MVDGFSFPDADGEPLASFDRLLVNLELSSLWRVGASFKEISIEQPYVRPVIRADGELNFADLAKPFPEEPEPAEPEEPPRLFIELFRMTEGHARFEDRTLATPYVPNLSPLSFELRDFSTIAGSDNAYDLRASAGTGATLDWSGNFTLSPLASAGKFKFANIDLTKHWGYAREQAGFDLSSGTVGFDGDYDFSAGQAGTQLTLQPARARDRRARHPPHRRGHGHRALRALHARELRLRPREEHGERREGAGGRRLRPCLARRRGQCEPRAAHRAGGGGGGGRRPRPARSPRRGRAEPAPRCAGRDRFALRLQRAGHRVRRARRLWSRTARSIPRSS